MKALKTLLLTAAMLIGMSQLSHAQNAAELEDVFNALDEKLEEYFMAMRTESPDVKIQEVDFLISTCDDSLTRQHVALKSYSYYMNSTVMGDEAVPVHLADTWFIPGKIAMMDDFDRLNAMVYAEFNRQSLLGQKAPQLRVETFEGDSLTVFGGGSKRYRILYFFDTGCAKCKIQSPLLTRAMNNLDYPVELYCFYTGSSKEAWKDYIDSNFGITAENVSVRHLWDPQRSSDFERKYGVLQTPRMLLVDRSGTIIGRGLDAEALITLLSDAFQLRDYQFGQDASSDLYDSIFANATERTLSDMADYIMESTLGQGDTLTYKKMTGDLLYWLSSQRSEILKASSAEFIRKHITQAPDIWTDSWDSLKVVGLGQMMEDLLGKAPIGQAIPSMKVAGSLITKKGEKAKSMNLRKLKAETNYIIFHTSGCSICEKELDAARKIISQQSGVKDVQVFAVNVDSIMDSKPDAAAALMDAFDLSGLPFMVQTDRNGIVRRKYLSLYNE